MSLVSSKLNNMLNSFDKNNKYASFKFLSNNLNKHIYNNFIEDFLNYAHIEDYPIVFPFLKKNKNFTLKDFYQCVISNSQHLTENEFNFIDKYFVSSYNSNIIFDILSTSKNLMPDTEFKSMIESIDSMDKQSFKELLTQLKLTHYTLHNFNKIDDDVLGKVFAVINIDKFKQHFLEYAIKHNRPILHSVFFDKFIDKENVYISDYINHAIKNNWSKHLVYLIKTFPNIIESHINKIESFSDKTLLNFEKLFLYIYPKKINLSHLNDSEIETVFSKIYETLPNKTYYHMENIKFYEDLGESLFKFIEVAYKKDPENIKHFLLNAYSLQSLKYLKSPTLLNKKTQKIHLFNYLLFNNQFIDPTLQISYQEKIINPLTKEFLQKDYLVNNLIDLSVCTEENTFIDFLSKNFQLINLEQKNKFLHMLIDNHFLSIKNKTYINSFRKKLASFSFQDLNSVQHNLENCLKIVELKYSLDMSENSQQITKLFYNILLEKKLVLKDDLPKQKHLKI